ncbi:hypothetical protein [Streptomyces sp. NPDC091259]|uniref:hypothetical protein n=1 Tax=Streptomyces sp. NPDC091259 TaxID=3365976 RepID=UPI0037F242A5
MSTPHRSRRRASLLGAAFAALPTTTAVCAGDAVARVFPYGHRHRGVNDLGNQFVPFHAYLWDLLHGPAEGAEQPLRPVGGALPAYGHRSGGVRRHRGRPWRRRPGRCSTVGGGPPALVVAALRAVTVRARRRRRG